jgi:hypothetical protein
LLWHALGLASIELAGKPPRSDRIGVCASHLPYFPNLTRNLPPYLYFLLSPHSFHISTNPAVDVIIEAIVVKYQRPLCSTKSAPAK